MAGRASEGASPARSRAVPEGTASLVVSSASLTWFLKRTAGQASEGPSQAKTPRQKTPRQKTIWREYVLWSCARRDLWGLRAS